MHGDPILLDLLVDNLIRNAMRHNVNGGQVWVSTNDHVLRVDNTGEPITRERLAELAEPFRRGTQDRVRGNGDVGLGLAIVTAVARAHHARLDLMPRPGGGIRADVRFPRTSQDPQASRSTS